MARAWQQQAGEVADAHDVLVGNNAEYLQVPPTSHLDQAVLREPPGSDLLLTANVERQLIKMVTRTDFPVHALISGTRTDFPVRAGQTIWLLPEFDKLRWLRSTHGLAPDGRNKPA